MSSTVDIELNYGLYTYVVVRDERLRSSFKTICWLNLSQQPEIIPLQQRLFAQLTFGDDAEMPSKARESIDGQIAELRRVAANRLILVVLDGAS